MDGFPPIYGGLSNDPTYYQVGFTKNILSVTPFINGKGGYVAISSNPYGADVFVSGVVGSNCVVKRYTIKPGMLKVKSLIPGGKSFTLLNYTSTIAYTGLTKNGQAFPLTGF